VGDDNPWLEPYYGGGAESMRDYALRLQLHFLATRFESMRRIRAQGGAGSSTAPGTRTPRCSRAGCTRRG
jgi:deoxyadenosine/deoxycytidine kinase